MPLHLGIEFVAARESGIPRWCNFMKANLGLCDRVIGPSGIETPPARRLSDKMSGG